MPHLFSFLKKRSVVFILFIPLCSISQAQTTRYVTASGTGDGSNWANASNNLQAIINLSSEGDEVWVATGTYKPNTHPRDITGAPTLTNRDFTFHLKKDVKIYGGFSGNETQLLQRDWIANRTIPVVKITVQ